MKLFRYSKTRKLKDVPDKALRVLGSHKILTFDGTVKVDGLNVAIVDIPGKTRNYQTRRTTSESTNLNDPVHFLNEWCTKRSYAFDNYITRMRDTYKEYAGVPLVIYGEFAGQQTKASSLVKHETFLYVFSVAFIDDMERYDDPNDNYKGFFIRDRFPFHYVADNIFDSRLVCNFSLDVDTADISRAVPEIEKQMNSTKECPVMKYLKLQPTPSEGIVYSHITDEGMKIMFKVVSKEYRKTKQPSMVEVDHVKVNSINEFLDYALTENRFNQAVDEVIVTNDNDTTLQRNVGLLNRWLLNDIKEEEKDVLIANGLVIKDLGKALNIRVKEMINKHVN